MKKGYYFIRLTSFAFILGVTGTLLSGRLHIETVEAVLMMTFLWAVFAFFGLFYTFIKNKKGSAYIVWYSLLFVFKLASALAGAFLFLSPHDEQIKTKALFYLFGYFALSMFDIHIKIRDLNKKLDK